MKPFLWRSKPVVIAHFNISNKIYDDHRHIIYNGQPNDSQHELCASCDFRRIVANREILTHFKFSGGKKKFSLFPHHTVFSSALGILLYAILITLNLLFLPLKSHTFLLTDPGIDSTKLI